MKTIENIEINCQLHPDFEGEVLIPLADLLAEFHLEQYDLGSEIVYDLEGMKEDFKGFAEQGSFSVIVGVESESDREDVAEESFDEVRRRPSCEGRTQSAWFEDRYDDEECEEEYPEDYGHW